MLESAAGLALVRALPADRLLTETYAPFTMVGNRMAEPSDVIDTMARLAAARRVTLEAMTATLNANATRVFAFAGVRDS